jgi:hypothetical protein
MITYETLPNHRITIQHPPYFRKHFRLAQTPICLLIDIVNFDLGGLVGKWGGSWVAWNEAQLCWLYEGIINIPCGSPLRMNICVGLRCT